MRAYHLCQDEFGLAFIVREEDDSSLTVVHHADKWTTAEHDAERMAERDGVELFRDANPSLTVPKWPEDYSEPAPRKAKV